MRHWVVVEQFIEQKLEQGFIFNCNFCQCFECYHVLALHAPADQLHSEDCHAHREDVGIQTSDVDRFATTTSRVRVDVPHLAGSVAFTARICAETPADLLTVLDWLRTSQQLFMALWKELLDDLSLFIRQRRAVTPCVFDNK